MSTASTTEGPADVADSFPPFSPNRPPSRHFGPSHRPWSLFLPCSFYTSKHQARKHRPRPGSRRLERSPQRTHFLQLPPAQRNGEDSTSPGVGYGSPLVCGSPGAEVQCQRPGEQVWATLQLRVACLGNATSLEMSDPPGLPDVHPHPWSATPHHPCKGEAPGNARAPASGVCEQQETHASASPSA